MKAVIEIGGHSAECALQVIGNIWTAELLPAWESAEVIMGARCGAPAKVTTAAGTFGGKVVITSPDDYVTELEMDAGYEEEDL